MKHLRPQRSEVIVEQIQFSAKKDEKREEPPKSRNVSLLCNTQDALFCVSDNADLLADGGDEVSLRSTA